MSRLVAFAAIQGAYNIVSKAEGKFKQAMDKYGPNQPIGFPNTAFYLPIIYSILGIKIEKLADAEPVMKICRGLLPEHIKAQHGINLPYLGGTLDFGYGGYPRRRSGRGDPLRGRPRFLPSV